jgi:hypothetical protein
MWKANGKMTTLLHSLGSLFTKTETIAKCFLLRKKNTPEEWRILGSIVRKMKYYIESSRNGTSCIQQNEEKLALLVTS